jgi:hypothetical protein
MYSSVPTYETAERHVEKSENTKDSGVIIMVETVARWGHNTLLIALGLMFYAIALSFK